MTLLEVKALTKKFGGLTAIDAVSLTIDPGKITAVIGPNGAGKTTFFNMITGMYQASSGEIYLEDRLLNRRKPDQLSRLGIARTFQNIRLFSELTVLDNILVAFHAHLKANLFSILFQLPKTRKEEKSAVLEAYHLLEYVGLAQFANETAENLSYGAKRKLEIARALATKPRLLLLDEPAAGMNPKETAQLTTLIQNIRADFNLTIVLIEHDMRLVMDISEQIYVLDHGVKIAEGSPIEIKNNLKVIEAYLGSEIGEGGIE